MRKELTHPHHDLDNVLRPEEDAVSKPQHYSRLRKRLTHPSRLLIRLSSAAAKLLQYRYWTGWKAQSTAARSVNMHMPHCQIYKHNQQTAQHVVLASCHMGSTESSSSYWLSQVITNLSSTTFLPSSTSVVNTRSLAVFCGRCHACTQAHKF